MTQVPAEHTPGRAQVLAVVNADAGSAHEEAVAAAAVALREEADVELVPTADLAEVRNTLEVQGERRLVVLGGDGSVHAVVQSLRDAGRLDAAGPVGILPLGTGNDLARSLGLPEDLHQAARIAVQGRAQPLALLVDEDGGVVVNVVHAGAGADASARAAQMQATAGVAAYPLGVVSAGVHAGSWRLRVSVDDGRVVHDGSEPVLLVAVGLGGHIGGGAEVLPGADLRDDVVDVAVSTETGLLARLGYAVQLATGTQASGSGGRRAQASSRVSVETVGDDETFHISADGEVSGPYRSRCWTVHPAAWQVRARL